MMIFKNLMNLCRGIIKAKQFCYIYSNVIIKKNVTIFPGAVIGRPPKSSGATKRETDINNLPPTIIENNCVIGSNAIIYKGTQIGKNSMICDTACVRELVKIGSNTLIAQGVTINVNTIIGNNVKIMDNCHITGNALIEDDVFIGMLTTTANDNSMGKGNIKLEFQKGPTIKKGAKIGQGSCLLPSITIGENAIVGANSVVTKDVLKDEIVMGIPAKGKNYEFKS
jgi:acetyltransferase-like isoleucine patch superfamily enzyme